jgi:hypothetical protein
MGKLQEIIGRLWKESTLYRSTLQSKTISPESKPYRERTFSFFILLDIIFICGCCDMQPGYRSFTQTDFSVILIEMVVYNGYIFYSSAFELGEVVDKIIDVHGFRLVA